LPLKFNIVECVRGSYDKGFVGQIRDSVSIHVHGERIFPTKKMFKMRMKDGDSVKNNLNDFNTVVIWFLSIDIKIPDEDKCINILCSLPYS